MKNNDCKLFLNNFVTNNSQLLDLKVETSLFYELNKKLFLLYKTFREKLVVMFANIRV